jgi:hypothetical protein
MVFTTKVGSAKAGTRSIKSTVPEGIVEFLQLKDKDDLEWTMDIRQNERIVIVKKALTTKEEVELARFAMKQKKRSD